MPRAKLLCEVLQKTGLIERSGQGVDKIFYYSILEGKALPDYSASDAYQVSLVLKSQIEDPAFHLFITKEQEKREENNKLSVFHLLALYKIKQGRSENIDNEILQKLLEDGLVEQEEDGVRLSMLYYEYEKYSRQLEDQVRDQVRDQAETIKVSIKILSALLESDKSRKSLMEVLGYKNVSKFRNTYLNPLMVSGLIVPVIEGKPTSPKQEYRLTEKGKAFLKEENKEE